MYKFSSMFVSDRLINFAVGPIL